MQKIFILLLFSLLLSGCSVRNLFIKKPAGLEIVTTPPSTVFINGQEEGSTPYKNQKVAPGDYTIRLVPEAADSLTPWETTFRLSPQVTTLINHTFAKSQEESSGYTLQLQPDSDKSKAYYSIISEPSNLNFSLDGKPIGFTPQTKELTTEGPHNLEVTSPSYEPLTISLNAVNGYNLVVTVKLAQKFIELEQIAPEATDSADLLDSESMESSESADIEDDDDSALLEDDVITKPYVIIEETVTGWLRVRDEPNTTTSQEIGKATVGEKYKYLESNDSGWYQIIFEGEQGWISGQFATIYQ